MNNNKAQKWVDKIIEASKHFGLDPKDLSRAKFDKFLYSKAAYRAAMELGSWEDGIRLASLEYNPELPIEIATKSTNIKKLASLYNSPFNFDFDKHKELTHPSSFIPAKKIKIQINPGDEIFFLPDIHFPFVHQKALILCLNNLTNIAKRCAEKKVTLHVVQLGDLYDLYSFSRFEKSHSIDPKREIDVAKDMATRMWEYIPSNEFVKRYQLIGNHDIRSHKYALAKAPELKNFLPSIAELMTFDNVLSAVNEKDIFVFETPTDKLAVMHGYLSKSEAHIFKFKCSVVHGHLHGMGITFRTLDTGLCFSMNSGLLGDSKTYPLAYSSTADSKDWAVGNSRVKVNKQGKFIPSLHPIFEGNDDV